MINVFVIEDHQVTINGLIAMFEPAIDKVKISGSANSAKEALPKLKRSHAKVVLLDLKMPNISGVEFCLKIKSLFPDKKVIVFTGETDTAMLYNVWNNGADAILSKYCDKDLLISAIKSVLIGNRIIGSKVPDFQHISQTDKKSKPYLTTTEQTILLLLSQGKTRKEVSKELDRSLNTIAFHTRNIFSKFKKTKLVNVIEDAKGYGLLG